MVVMSVRDQHGIERRVESGGRSGAAQVDYLFTQERIGEHAHAVEVIRTVECPSQRTCTGCYLPRPRMRAKRSRV